MPICSPTLLGIAMLLTALCVAGPSPPWIRYPAISLDGPFVALGCQGDRYKVAASGGQAFSLTLHEGPDFMPV